MRRADVAMYAAKAARAGTMIYDPRQDEHSPGRIRLVNELRTSIDDRHLELHYQPEIDLRSGRVVRVEALLRWNHPERGRLLPDEFLPLVASSDLIDRIARWVLRTAIRDCSEWERSGMRHHTRASAPSVIILPRMAVKPHSSTQKWICSCALVAEDSGFTSWENGA